jgi:hypothetical protein
MWCFVLDNLASRKITSWKMDRVADQARKTLHDPRFAKQLLAMTDSKNNFKACRATATLGRLGEAAKPVILEIAALMDSPNPCVSQEAAKALGRLGPLSEPALPHLKARIEKEPNDATTWFAIQAIGEIGPPAVECLPLLRGKQGSEPKMFEGTVLRTIQKLEGMVTVNPYERFRF